MLFLIVFMVLVLTNKLPVPSDGALAMGVAALVELLVELGTLAYHWNHVL